MSDVRITISGLPSEVVQAIDRLAEEAERSRAEIIRMLLEDAVRRGRSRKGEAHAA